MAIVIPVLTDIYNLAVGIAAKLTLFAYLIPSLLLIYLLNQFGVLDWIREMLAKFYDTLRWVLSWITQTFHYNKPEEILVLTLVYTLGMLLLVYFIGGDGIGGADYGGSGLLGLNEAGVSIGSDSVVGDISAGVRSPSDVGIGLVTTTLGDTTSTISEGLGEGDPDDLSCSSNSRCAVLFPMSAGYGLAYCCPIETGSCGGFCNTDCVPDCDEYCSEYDYSYSPPICIDTGCVVGTEDYGSCYQNCVTDTCVKSLEVTYLLSPAAGNYVSGEVINFRWT